MSDLSSRDRRLFGVDARSLWMISVGIPAGSGLKALAENNVMQKQDLGNIRNFLSGLGFNPKL